MAGTTWSITSGSLPAGLTLSASGTISGTPTTAGLATFTATVTDSANHKASQPLSITIQPATLTVTTTSLTPGTIGASYSQTLVAVGGSGGNTWSISSGSLPAGLTLGASGTITGTPTTAGTASFTATVTDSTNHTASQPLSLTIGSATLTIVTTSLTPGTVGASYSQTLFATGGSFGNVWTTTAGALPAGLTLSASGTISGTPTTAGTASFTATVTDSANHTDSQPLNLTIQPATLTITTTSLAPGTVGASYSQTLVANGGSGGNTWSVTAGSLPPG